MFTLSPHDKIHQSKVGYTLCLENVQRLKGRFARWLSCSR